MQSLLNQLLASAQTCSAVLVTVEHTQGSTPRAVGAWMAVSAHQVWGMIGGGHIELQAIAHARDLLAGGTEPVQQCYALGPNLGQCCGGVMVLAFERLTSQHAASLRERLQPQDVLNVALFGGGHVGTALVNLLGTLPFSVQWYDSRDEIFPNPLPSNVSAEHSSPIEAAVRDLVPGTQVLIMSFSHAEDLDIVAACLQRQRGAADLPYIGLIGSKTKWATFSKRLIQRGFSDTELAQITCPIGVPGVMGKEPEVIAVAVAAQLLQRRDVLFNAESR
jgi:xanthine dehydrogenase accessory factor